MIRYFRNNVQGNIAKVFIVLICIPFVLVGVDSFFASDTNPNVAKVNGDKITTNELNNEAQRLLSQIMSMQGDSFDPTSIDAETLKPRALENLLDRRLLEQLADDAGFGVSPKEIDNLIVEQTMFHQDGKFSASLYENLLRSNNLTSLQYKEMVARDIVFSQVNSGLSNAQFVTKNELEQRVKLDYESRDLQYFEFDKVVEAGAISVSQAEIDTFYEENSMNYMTDEMVSVDYVEIKIESYFADVDEADIEQAYQQQLTEMTLPEQRKPAHILLEFGNAKEKAVATETLNAIKVRLDGGESFADLASEFSNDVGSASSGGALEFTSGELFPEAFEVTLAALALNQVSDIIETDAGLHLIKLLEIQKGDTPSLESMRAGLVSQLQRLKARPQFDEALELLKDTAFDSDVIQDVATELGQTILNSGSFTQQGANSGLFSRNDLVKAAFSNDVLLDGRISDVLELSPERYVVIQRNSHTLPQQKPLADVSEQIKAVLLEDAVQSALQTKAETVLTAVEEGRTLDSLAEEYKLTLQRYDGVTRRDPKGADRQIIGAAFELSAENEQGVVEKISKSNGSIAIVKVSNIVPGSVDKIQTQEFDSIKNLLVRIKSNNESTAFQAALTENADIKVL